ncbi:MAG: hypothetical protein LBR74_01600 [Eubacterium sp.]|jgi:phage tail-like protein|nr:hypothetical protein [Eubacterium sp.]
MNKLLQKQYNDRLSFSVDETHVYWSPVFDSGADDTSWDRIILDVPQKASFQIKVFLSNEAFGIEKTKPAMVGKYADMLLYAGQVKGRYLQFSLSGSLLFCGYSVRYPKITFTDYLPEIYRGNELLERFLAVFQNEYLDREREISLFYRQLDPLTCKEESIANIAKMLGAEALLFAPHDVRRKLLLNATLLNRLKGTRNAVKLLVYLTIGQHPLVLEEPGQIRFRILLSKAIESQQESLLNILLPFYIPYPLTYTICYPFLDSTLDGNSYLGYCHCSCEREIIVGLCRIGELICL